MNSLKIQIPGSDLHQGNKTSGGGGGGGRDLNIFEDSLVVLTVTQDLVTGGLLFSLLTNHQPRKIPRRFDTM